MSGTTQQQVGGVAVTVTLPVATWNTIIDILARQPWGKVNGLILSIAQPMQAQVNTAMAPPPAPNGHVVSGAPNGFDIEAPAP